MHFFIEAIVVGIIIVIIGSFIGWALPAAFRVELPQECKDWNKKYAMQVSLFFTGFLAHCLFELAGTNKWYCKNGYACSKDM